MLPAFPFFNLFPIKAPLAARLKCRDFAGSREAANGVGMNPQVISYLADKINFLTVHFSNYPSRPQYMQIISISSGSKLMALEILA